MKKSIKALAAVTAAVMSVTACVPALVYADKNVSVSQAKEDKTEMETALAKVKERVTIPEELSEFEYDTSMNYGKKMFAFTWHTPDGAEQYKYIKAAIVGDVINYYYDGTNADKNVQNDPTLARLTEQQLLAKAKEYVKKLDPDIYPKLKFELTRLSLNSSMAVVSFTRYEKGIPVTGNEGTVRLDKNTGALTQVSLGWWEDAAFADSSAALTEEQMETAYQSICTLTPYYELSYDWNEAKQKNVPKFTIVYAPDMTSEIDAFTGKESTIWDDRETSNGYRYYYNYEEYGYDYDEAATADAGEGMANPTAGRNFTPAELEKIQKDNSLITSDKATEMLKKDKFAALTDDYELQSYNIYTQKELDDKEIYILSLSYKIKSGVSGNFYKYFNVEMNAETGEMLAMSKSGLNDLRELPKLDVTKANATAKEVAKTYAKDIISEYKADKDNTKPAEVYSSTSCETSRTFIFNRYVNDIQVDGDRIWVTVDSNGVVTEYSYNYTEGVKFPSADILSTADAFAKLYKQQKFELYYDGWVTKDGSVHTYLVYDMDSFYLNAKTGALCSRNGSKPYSYTDVRDVKYTDIAGIPQEKAILELQKYGVGVTADKKFEPDNLITEEEFQSLLSNTVGWYSAYAVNDKGDDEAVKLDKAETTMREAAEMFGKMYLSEDVAVLKGVFRSPFTDVKSSDPDVGYIAVAKAKGFVTGSADGTLGGDKKITRAEAVQMIYDYLVFISK